MAKIIDKIKEWWRDRNDPLCRECGLGYAEAREAIKESEHYRQRAYELAEAEGRALDLIENLIARNMTQRDLLVMVENHFVLLKRVAESPGPIKHEDKIISKYKVIATECEAAYLRVQKHLTENP